MWPSAAEWEVIALHPRLAFTSVSDDPKEPLCSVSVSFISASDAHAEQSDTSRRAAAADSSQNIHRSERWVSICDQGLCTRISFPTIRRQLDNTMLKERQTANDPVPKGPPL
ncbi:hypothetical protein F2P81_013394 [Scophthalmus maximus]|uniref:Uncharacterized protein n=1 Tax=Scophthalmus maximus TaxID=52904 RepID=A0A6A4SMF2_SCOMX|nr:hypothetical protein F2P81_013394 [Scophthalmus maximus]